MMSNKRKQFDVKQCPCRCQWERHKMKFMRLEMCSICTTQIDPVRCVCVCVSFCVSLWMCMYVCMRACTSVSLTYTAHLFAYIIRGNPKGWAGISDEVIGLHSQSRSVHEYVQCAWPGKIPRCVCDSASLPASVCVYQSQSLFLPFLSVSHFSVFPCVSVRYGAVLCCAVLCCAVLCCAVLCIPIVCVFFRMAMAALPGKSSLIGTREPDNPQHYLYTNQHLLRVDSDRIIYGINSPAKYFWPSFIILYFPNAYICCRHVRNHDSLSISKREMAKTMFDLFDTDNRWEEKNMLGW